jgi:predicted permease
MIRKSPGFSAVAIVSLAIGIGASTVLFSFANAFLFRPVHARNPSELVQVFTSGSQGSLYGGSSYPDYEDFRDSAGIFGGLLASARARATLSDAERPEPIAGLLVSGNYFEVLGLQPSRGRFFAAEETRTPMTHPVVIVSHQAWLRRFGSDPDVLGRVIRMNGHPFTVIGIGPRDFVGTSIEEAAEFFVPLMMHAVISPETDILRSRGARVLSVFGRLKPGMTLREADAALRVVAAQQLQRDPDAWRDRSGRGRTITVLPELEARLAGSGPGPVVWILSAVVAGVLTLLGIACVNVATVLLARATTRRKEIAIRLALGASRRRVVGQLLTECALLAATGCVLGLAIAHTAAGLFARFHPAEAPPFDLSLDYRILLFSVLASSMAVFFFGLAPALQSTRPDVNAELKDGTRAVRVRRFNFDLRDALVVVQVALALAMMVGAALLYRSFLASANEDLGFRRDGVLSVEVDLTTISPAGDAHGRFYREAERTLAGLAGVRQVALAALVPMDGSNMSTTLVIREGGSPVSIYPDLNMVSAGYFSLLGIPVLKGREFAPSDRAGAPRVAVVNETMAQWHWKGDAIGRVLADKDGRTDVHIVGIVRDLRHRSFAEKPIPMLYLAADQSFRPRMTVHLRTDGPPAAIGAGVVRTLREIHPAAGLTRVRTMEEYLSDVTMPQRLGGWAALATGGLELSLALMALYGVIAYAASQRTREVGIRLALGATAGSVVLLMMRKGIVLAGVGIVTGLGIALASGPVLGSLLIGIGPADPVSFVGAAAFLLLIAAIASYLPARRALRINPSAALRAE